MTAITDVRSTNPLQYQYQTPVPPMNTEVEQSSSSGVQAAPAMPSYEPFATETMSTLLAVQERPSIASTLDTQKVQEQMQALGVEGSRSPEVGESRGDARHAQMMERSRAAAGNMAEGMESMIAAREKHLAWSNGQIDYLNGLLAKNPGNQYVMEDLANMKKHIAESKTDIGSSRDYLADFRKEHGLSAATKPNA